MITHDHFTQSFFLCTEKIQPKTKCYHLCGHQQHPGFDFSIFQILVTVGLLVSIHFYNIDLPIRETLNFHIVLESVDQFLHFLNQKCLNILTLIYTQFSDI